MAKRKWSDLSLAARILVVVAGIIQVTLAVVAGVDLARRPAEEVRGPKPAWAARPATPSHTGGAGPGLGGDLHGIPGGAERRGVGEVEVADLGNGEAPV